MPKSSSSAARALSPSTPSGISTATTLCILWATSPKTPSPSPRTPSSIARAVQHCRRLGVVVEPPRSPVVHDLREVEVVAGDPLAVVDVVVRPDPRLHVLAGVDHLGGALGDRDGSAAGRAAEA